VLLALLGPEDEGTVVLWNIGTCWPNDSSHSKSRES